MMAGGGAEAAAARAVQEANAERRAGGGEWALSTCSENCSGPAGCKCARVRAMAAVEVTNGRAATKAAWRRWMRLGGWGALAEEESAATRRRRLAKQAQAQAARGLATWGARSVLVKLRGAGSTEQVAAGTCSGELAEGGMIRRQLLEAHPLARVGPMRRQKRTRRRAAKRKLDPEVAEGRRPDARGRWAVQELVRVKWRRGGRGKPALMALVRWAGRSQHTGRKWGCRWVRALAPGSLTAALQVEARDLRDAMVRGRQVLERRAHERYEEGLRRSGRLRGEAAEGEAEAGEETEDEEEGEEGRGDEAQAMAAGEQGETPMEVEDVREAEAGAAGAEELPLGFSRVDEVIKMRRRGRREEVLVRWARGAAGEEWEPEWREIKDVTGWDDRLSELREARRRAKAGRGGGGAKRATPAQRAAEKRAAEEATQAEADRRKEAVAAARAERDERLEERKRQREQSLADWERPAQQQKRNARGGGGGSEETASGERRS